MTITFELDREEAEEVLRWIHESLKGGALRNLLALVLADSFEQAIHNEDERQAELHHERLMSEGGNPARERQIREYEEKTK